MGSKKAPVRKRAAVVQNEAPARVAHEIAREQSAMVRNGLADALGLNDFGFGPGQNVGSQLSQVDTLFKNNRWYLVSNMRQLLSEIYVEHGLVQTIVNVPVDDGLRGGVEIKSKQLDDAQIEQLQVSMDRDNDIGNVGQAIKWNRLYGGAGVLVMTDQDPEEPLNIDAIRPDSPLEFRPVDMWELFWDKQNTEGYDPEIQSQDFEFYNYYAKKLHKSRVMRMKGLIAPSFIRPRLRGWGFSVVESLVRSINQYLKANDLGFEVLDEFKLDIFKIKNLTSSLLSPQAQTVIQQRVQLANRQKNFQHAITMDSEDDYVQKQLSFAGLAETMQGIRIQIASDMRMPLTKIFGISATGFNSGEDDIEVYNSMVESEVREKSKYEILRVIEIKCQKLFGFIPDDLSIDFKPLRMLSAEQEENVKTQKFTRLLQAKQAGELTTLEFRDACNRDNLLGIQLDTSQDLLNPDDPNVAEVVKEEPNRDPKETTDVDDPGANKEDTRKPRAWDTKTPKKPVENSAAFDKASYEADGGDAWVDPGRVHFFDHPPVNVDSAKWAQARAASQKVFGREKWQFVLWTYKKLGGKM